MKWKSEKAYADTCQSFTEQVEELQGMLSDCSREVQMWHKKYDELDQKFKDYYTKSDV